MNKKGESFGCLAGILGAVIFTVGLFICILSRFYCVELDFSEEQRNSCETKANILLIFGFLMIIGSTFVMFFGAKFLGFSDKNKDKIE